MSGTDSLIAELRGHLEHGISSEAIEAAADAIATLTEERDRNQRLVSDSEAERYRSCSALLERATAAEAERDALREALAPFAKIADELDALRHEDGSTCLWRLKAIDIRRARALAKGECK